jgi:lipopolysaccharide export system protein LptA
LRPPKQKGSGRSQAEAGGCSLFSENAYFLRQAPAICAIIYTRAGLGFRQTAAGRPSFWQHAAQVGKMKKFLRALAVFLVLAALGAGGEAAKQRPVVTSDKQRFDPSQGLYFLEGNVYVAIANRIITADKASVDIVGLKVWAEGNVTLKQGDITFAGDSLYVDGGKSTAEIAGHLRFAREGLAIAAEYAEFNWKTKIAHLTGNVVVTQQGGDARYESVRYDVRGNRFLH